MWACSRLKTCGQWFLNYPLSAPPFERGLFVYTAYQSFLSALPAFFAAAFIAVEEAVNECRKSCTDKRSSYEQPNLLDRYRISTEQAHKCRAEAACRVHRRSRIGDAHEVNKGQRQAYNK